MQLPCWFLPLSQSQIPSSQDELPLKGESSVTAEQFFESGIQTSFHMVGGFWYRWVGDKSEQIRNGVLEKRASSSEASVGVPPMTRRAVATVFEKLIVTSIPSPKLSHPPSLLSFGLDGGQFFHES